MRRYSSDLRTLTLGLNCDLLTFPERNKAAYLLLVRVDLQVFHESKLYPLFYNLQVGCNACVMLGQKGLWIVCAGTLEASDSDVCFRVDSFLWSGLERTAAAFCGQAVWEESVNFLCPHCTTPLFSSDPLWKSVNVTHAVHCNHKQYVITLNINCTLASAYCNIAAREVKHFSHMNNFYFYFSLMLWDT